MWEGKKSKDWVLDILKRLGRRGGISKGDWKGVISELGGKLDLEVY